VKDQRIGGGSPFGVKDFLHSVRADSEGAQSIDRFGGKGDEVTSLEDLASLTERAG